MDTAVELVCMEMTTHEHDAREAILDKDTKIHQKNQY